jgi:hypothetical protein
MKRTYKLQALVTEEEFVTLKRMQFWANLDGDHDARSLSTFARKLLLQAIANAPEEMKQSVKNYRK